MSLFLIIMPFLMPVAAFAVYRVIVRTGHESGWRFIGLALFALSLIGCIGTVIGIVGGPEGVMVLSFILVPLVSVLIVVASLVVALKSWPIDPLILSEAG